MIAQPRVTEVDEAHAHACTSYCITLIYSMKLYLHCDRYDQAWTRRRFKEARAEPICAVNS